MIYLLSDLHGDINMKGFQEYIKCAEANDLLIVLGDTELSFSDTDENRRFTEAFLKTEKNIAILDGNHDNFAFFNGFPEEQWHGGCVNRMTEHIVHLKRGNVYTVEGKSFFAFGGCKSSPKWKEMGLWYDGEEATDAELELAYEALKKRNYKVDYVLTHKYEETPARGTVSEKLRQLTAYIEENAEYRMWYSGHWHTSGRVDDTHMLVYDELLTVE